MQLVFVYESQKHKISCVSIGRMCHAVIDAGKINDMIDKFQLLMWDF